MLFTDSVAADKGLDRWNWSNNIEFSAKYLETPASADEL